MSKTLKIILGVVVLVIIVGLIFVFGGEKEEKEMIKIGVVGHFTGEYATYGVPMKNAVKLAVEEINKNDGINGQLIELIIEDDLGNSTNAASAVNKLINVDGVNYIISAQGSGATSAITPIAQSNKRILVITLASAPGLTNAGEYVFRSVPSDAYQGIKIADFIDSSLSARKVAGLYVNDAYGVGIRDVVQKNIKARLGVQEIFSSSTSDFRSQLMKIKNDKADVLVLVSRKETPSILKQIKELDLDVKIVGSETVKDDEILKESGNSAEGIYAAFMAQPKDKNYIDFANKYKMKFNKEPSTYSMYAYDGLIALAKAIRSGKGNVETVKRTLLGITFNGASGYFTLNEQRERTGVEYIIYVVKNGQFVLLENY